MQRRRRSASIAQRSEASSRASLVRTKFPDAERTCPTCHVEAKPAGTKSSTEFDYVPGYFRRKVHRARDALLLVWLHRDGVGAAARIRPLSVQPGFIAHLVVQKCGDSLTDYRIEKQFKRLGIPMSRSTMTELFHRADVLLRRLAKRVIALVAASEVVLANETTLPMLGTIKRDEDGNLKRKPKRTYLWTFVSGDFVA